MSYDTALSALPGTGTAQSHTTCNARAIRGCVRLDGLSTHTFSRLSWLHFVIHHFIWREAVLDQGQALTRHLGVTEYNGKSRAIMDTIDGRMHW
jgi:hypothetical protein